LIPCTFGDYITGLEPVADTTVDDFVEKRLMVHCMTAIYTTAASGGWFGRAFEW